MILSYLGGAWDVAAWAFVALMIVVAVSRRVGGTAPTLLQPLQAVLPLLFLPVYVVLAGAILGRRWLLVAVAVLLALVHWFSVAPARGVDDAPYWVGRGATLRIAEANLYDENPTISATIESLRSVDADVVVLVEVTLEWDAAMEREGLYAHYPHRIVEPVRGGMGSAILSKFALTDVGRLTRNRLPVADVTLPNGQVVRVVTVHPDPPVRSSPSAKEWTEDMGLLGRYAARTEGPIALVGDFNGTRWQPAFGSLLGGLRDVHEATGEGLSYSWPTNRFRRFARLDHALVGDDLFPISTEEIALPGSDHNGFVATLTVRPRNEPGADGSVPDGSVADGTVPDGSVADGTVAEGSVGR